MGKIHKHHLVKLTTGLIYAKPLAFEKAKRLLIKKFGEVDFESPPMDFHHTLYYREEMGEGLLRVFLSFKKLIRAENLPAIKHFTNRVEEKLSVKGSRAVNIDPGYLDLAKLILATTKDFSHRVTLGRGIFADLTLSFKDRSFRTHPWTYLDYRTPEYIAVFNQIRKLYASQI